MKNKSYSAAFTLVELIVVVTVMGLLTPVVLGVMGDFYTNTNTLLQQTTKYADSQDALATIKNDMTTSTNVLAKSVDDSASFPNLATDIPANNDDKWTVTSSDPTHQVLITESYLTSTDTGGKTVPGFTGCSGTITQAKVMRVYFVQGSTLYRRTILPIADTATPTTQYCGNQPIQKQSCSSLSVSPACKAIDAVLEHNVTEFKIDYYKYSQDTNALSMTDVLNAGINGIQKVTATIVTTQRVNGNDMRQSASSQFAVTNTGDRLSATSSTGTPLPSPGADDPGVAASSCTGNTSSDGWDVKIAYDRNDNITTNAPFLVDAAKRVIKVSSSKTNVDYFLVGGGGAGQGGWIWAAGGGGGRGGSIYVGSTNISSVRVDADFTRSLSFDLGVGGRGTRGSGYYSTSSFPFFTIVPVPESGGNGTPTLLSAAGMGIFALANGGQGGSGANNNKAGMYPIPGTQVYLGLGYCAGQAPGTNPGGFSDGGAANGGQPITDSKTAGSAGAGGSGISGDNFSWSSPFAARKGGDGAGGIIRLRFR